MTLEQILKGLDHQCDWTAGEAQIANSHTQSFTTWLLNAEPELYMSRSIGALQPLWTPHAVRKLVEMGREDALKSVVTENQSSFGL